MNTHYDRQYIADQFLKLKSITKVAAQEKMAFKTVKKILLEEGIPIKPWKATFNKKYFEKIDSHEKAYFLGLIFADGCIYKSKSNVENVFKLKLAEKDSYLIEGLSEAINFSKDLYTTILHGNCQNQKTLRLTNCEFVKYLIDVGLKGNKTYEGGLPLIDEEFESSFILGYFDGDGSFTAEENETDTVRKVAFSFCSCREHLTYIYNILNKNKISSHLYKDKRTEACSLVIGGSTHAVKFFRFIYQKKKEIRVFLKRKYFKSLYFLLKFGFYTKDKYNIPKLIRRRNLARWGAENLNNIQAKELEKECLVIKQLTLKPSKETSKMFESEIEEKYFTELGVIL